MDLGCDCVDANPRTAARPRAVPLWPAACGRPSASAGRRCRRSDSAGGPQAILAYASRTLTLSQNRNGTPLRHGPGNCPNACGPGAADRLSSGLWGITRLCFPPAARNRPPGGRRRDRQCCGNRLLANLGRGGGRRGAWGLGLLLARLLLQGSDRRYLAAVSLSLTAVEGSSVLREVGCGRCFPRQVFRAAPVRHASGCWHLRHAAGPLPNRQPDVGCPLGDSCAGSRLARSRMAAVMVATLIVQTATTSNVEKRGWVAQSPHARLGQIDPRRSSRRGGDGVVMTTALSDIIVSPRNLTRFKTIAGAPCDVPASGR